MRSNNYGLPRKVAAFFIAVVLLVGCTSGEEETEQRYERFTYEFFGVFDTYISILAFAECEDDFANFSRFVYSRMNELHQLYSIFNEYEGMNNIKTINDNAGESVVVCNDIFDLIEFAINWYHNTGGAFNIALGPVTQVWREYRERYQFAIDGQTNLPDMEYLESLRHLTDIGGVVLNRAEMTVMLTEQGMSLDVGSVAKGFAVQRVIIEARLLNFPVNHFLIDAGGHVRVFGTHQQRQSGLWHIEVLNPYDPNEPLETFRLPGGWSVDTSGNYQRYFVYEGNVLGHVISPFTLKPAQGFTSVTVVANNSAVADVLSTALNVVTHQAGIDMARIRARNVVWLLPGGGTRFYPYF